MVLNPVALRIENNRTWSWYHTGHFKQLDKMVINCVSNHIEIYLIRASS